MENLDDVSPERRAAVIESVRAVLSKEVSEYCTDSDVWRFSVARQLSVVIFLSFFIPLLHIAFSYHFFQFVLNQEKAKEMIESWYKWRIDDKVDQFVIPEPDNSLPIPYPIRGFESFADSNLTAGKNIPDSMMTMNSLFGGGCWHKVDRSGNPIYIDRLGYYDVKGIPKKITIEELLENHYLLQEFCRRSIMTSCSKTAGKEISKQTVIFDLSGVGLGMLHRPALNMLSEMLKNDQLYFPESMIHTFFINVPTVFVTLWAVVKVWLDSRVLSKITIAGKNYKETLLKYIDADNLPVMYGGNCTCSHMPGGCVPSPPKHNFVDLPREAYSTFSNKATLDPQNPSLSTTFTPPQRDSTPKVVEKSGWFGSKKSVAEDSEDRYVLVYFSTGSGRGIVFKSVWKPAPTSGADPVVVYNEHLFESQRSPSIVEIKLPGNLPSGELSITFRLPRDDEGACVLPSPEDSKKPVNLEYDIMMESIALKKFGLPPVNRKI
ncbi:Phosphatidylinositol/phosphatidylcholine transfer protein SFH11 [Smittium mucronatum]|uniref:Phosphatidylinositol/phosphatidylcholine transfer protein SFH11 n=1 Tax=Smittium mucronatum TaxID=133383 RepID=A0A1R0H1E6_9FUNG|nr:Phosphatidylinositol/phosphatidylcholine transfer protein SFH11 [Smittium mucronatum]